VCRAEVLAILGVEFRPMVDVIHGLVELCWWSFFFFFFFFVYSLLVCDLFRS